MAPPSNPQAPNTTSTSSVRRNLFTNHLSHRRTDAAAPIRQASEPIRNPSANSSTHSLSNLSNAPPLPPLRRPTPHTRSNDSLNTQHPVRPSSTNTELSSINNNTNPNNDIVTRDRTGRPDLPEIPILPPHLRLSASDPHDRDSTEEGVGMEDVEGMELESAMREKEDQERIEKSLVDMMYRSRMRGHGHQGHGGGAGGGLGAENEELLALVQASLRKKAASLEEDRWMFEADAGDDDYGSLGYGFR